MRLNTFVYKHICTWFGYLKPDATIQWLTDLQCKYASLMDEREAQRECLYSDKIIRDI